MKTTTLSRASTLHALLLLLLLLGAAAAQSPSDQIFQYTQVMSACVGSQFIDQQMARMVTAVRRCEQAAPQPLRDRALESVISNLQAGTGRDRVVYVPVAVSQGLGGLGSFGNLGGVGGGFPFNTLNPGVFRPILGNQFGTSFNRDQTTINRLDNQDRFSSLDSFNNRRQPDSAFGVNNQRTPFGLSRTSSDRATTTRNSNPFGFTFGKQTVKGDSDSTVEIHPEGATNAADVPHERSTRQINSNARTRLEALNYLSNMTCVMREASMIDHNNLPNYQFFENELRRIQVGRDLRNDLASGLLFCKELTQCMSVERLSHPLARELGQAVAYLRCIAKTNVKGCKKAEERRVRGNSRLTGAFNVFSGNGLDLLNSVTELALSDNVLGFDFF